ncbi:flavin reductase [Streptomyces sp. NPDC101455]|uniref:flavin reductase n=1 Tax=Streptomyces sp. NPDC101455 TaxID=3366142 RepID=UPI00380B3177
MHTYPDLAFLGALASTGEVSAELLHDADAVEYLASRIHPDHELLSRYHHLDPDRLLDCPVTVGTGTEDSASSYRDFDLWAALTTGPVNHLELAGAGHLFLDSHAGAVAARIHATLLDERGDPWDCPPAGPAAGPLDREAFRDAMASLAAPVTVVTTWDAEGRARAFTASAVCSLSADPPLLLVCVNRAGHAHEVFRTADRFLVNVLGHEQAVVAKDLGAALLE